MPKINEIKKIEWDKGGDKALSRMALGKKLTEQEIKDNQFLVFDINSGITFYMVRTAGSNHNDVEYATAGDAQRMLDILGAKDFASWTRRPIMVIQGNSAIMATWTTTNHAGRDNLATWASMPNGDDYGKYVGSRNYDAIKNGVNGHMDVYFHRSIGHGQVGGKVFSTFSYDKLTKLWESNSHYPVMMNLESKVAAGQINIGTLNNSKYGINASNSDKNPVNIDTKTEANIKTSTETGTNSKTDSNKIILDMIDLGKTKLDKPYVWGSMGPNSFDCSGFTSFLYKTVAGITLPRTSVEQAKAGKEIPVGQMQPGDILAFQQNGKVDHVAMYIGNDQVIHAASHKKKVVIENYKGSYLERRISTVRRFIDSNGTVQVPTGENQPVSESGSSGGTVTVSSESRVPKNLKLVKDDTWDTKMEGFISEETIDKLQQLWASQAKPTLKWDWNTDKLRDKMNEPINYGYGITPFEEIDLKNKTYNKDLKDDEKKTLKDKYGREEYFRIPPELLYSLNQTVYKDQFLHSESFIKPVKVNEESWQLDAKAFEPNNKDEKENRIEYGLGTVFIYRPLITYQIQRGIEINQTAVPSGNGTEWESKPDGRVIANADCKIEYVLERAITFEGEYIFKYEEDVRAVQEQNVKNIAYDASKGVYTGNLIQSKVYEVTEVPSGIVFKDKGREYLYNYLENFVTEIPTDVIESFNKQRIYDAFQGYALSESSDANTTVNLENGGGANFTTNTGITFEAFAKKQQNLYPSGDFGTYSVSDYQTWANPNYNIDKTGGLQHLRLDVFRPVNVEILEAEVKKNGRTPVIKESADEIIVVAQRYNIDPVFLFTQIMHESGWGGKPGGLGAGGPCPHCGKTVYNLTGVGAIDGSPLYSGRKEACKRGWYTFEAALEGSAKFVVTDYIHNQKKKQNTIYKIRFNCTPSFNHGYASDIKYADTFAKAFKKYMDKGVYKNKEALVFDIPVFNPGQPVGSTGGTLIGGGLDLKDLPETPQPLPSNANPKLVEQYDKFEKKGWYKSNSRYSAKADDTQAELMLATATALREEESITEVDGGGYSFWDYKFIEKNFENGMPKGLAIEDFRTSSINSSDWNKIVKICSYIGNNIGKMQVGKVQPFNSANFIGHSYLVNANISLPRSASEMILKIKTKLDDEKDIQMGDILILSTKQEGEDASELSSVYPTQAAICISKDKFALVEANRVQSYSLDVLKQSYDVSRLLRPIAGAKTAGTAPGILGGTSGQNANSDTTVYPYTPGEWAWPSNAIRISSDFGPRKSPGGKGSTNHKGIDISPKVGGVVKYPDAPIFATKDGTITKVVNHLSIGGGGYGNVVFIDHGNGQSSTYGHLKKGTVLVTEGQKVTKGQKIATMGTTGVSTGVHLHFEIRMNNVPQNPEKLLTLPPNVIIERS